MTITASPVDPPRAASADTATVTTGRVDGIDFAKAAADALAKVPAIGDDDRHARSARASSRSPARLRRVAGSAIGAGG